jgi:hypothetical protein
MVPGQGDHAVVGRDENDAAHGTPPGDVRRHARAETAPREHDPLRVYVRTAGEGVEHHLRISAQRALRGAALARPVPAVIDEGQRPVLGPGLEHLPSDVLGVTAVVDDQGSGTAAPGRGEPAADAWPVGDRKHDLLHRPREAHPARRPGGEVRQEQHAVLGEERGGRHAERERHGEEEPADHALPARPAVSARGGRAARTGARRSTPPTG